MGWQDAPEVEAAPKWQSAPEASQQQPAPALPPQPTPLHRALSAIVRGLPGGPAGVLGTTVGEGLSQGSKALEKGAYETGGAVTDILSSGNRVPLNPLGLKLPPEQAAGAGFATNVAMQAAPAVIGGMAAGQQAAPAMERGSKILMQQALKPTYSDLRTGDAAKAIDTMLQEGLNVTPGGVRALRDRIGQLNDEISQVVAQSPASVTKGEAGAELLRSLRQFSRQVRPQADISEIRAAWQDFLNHPLISGDKIPVPLAQELKQGTYRVLADKYGEMGSAATEAQKDLARGLKNAIADKVPEVGPLNAKESQLLNALDITERRVLMKYNNNVAGLSLLAKNPKAWAAFMADRSPLFKSIIARMMYSGSEAIPQTAAGGAIAVGQATLPKTQQ